MKTIPVSRDGSVELPTAGRPIREQPHGWDLLSLPGLRRLSRWRYARLLLQLPLLLLAIFAIVDGLTGRQLAPRNVATTSVWLHYRGLVVIALALLGNAFCASCPLMLTRGLTRRLERLLPSKLPWPSRLSNKYLVLALLVVFFYSYEAFDLWASPWLTAWLIIGYFLGALAIDTLFPAGTFCRYVCPLGNFNFVLASTSPTQIRAVDHDICRQCVEKPCLHGRETYSDPSRASGEYAFIPLDQLVNANGEGRFPGCETRLFAPTIQSNMDCTACLNCVRACPYDNVAITVRAPIFESDHEPWQRRGRVPLMVTGVLLAFLGLFNAAAMVGPFQLFAANVARSLSITNESLLLAVLFAVTLVGGMLLGLGASWLADAAGGERRSPWKSLERWGYVIVILAVGFWASHYLFHFLSGAPSVLPVFQHFFSYRGADIVPDWGAALQIPTSYLYPIPAGIIVAYTLLAGTVTIRTALKHFGRRGALAMWPMLLFVVAFSMLGMWLISQPMEMRGTLLAPTL